MLLFLHFIDVLMLFLKRNFFFFCFALFALQLQAQIEGYKNYSIQEGLPQSEVYDAIQDPVGYLWFATQGGGIAKFDGTTFEVYNQNNGLISNYVNALYLLDQQLFIGTNKGLSIWSHKQFTNFKSPKVNKVIPLNQQIYLATEEGIYHFKSDYVVPIKINLRIDLSEITDIRYQNAFYWIVTTKDVWKVKTLNQPKSIQKATLKERNELFANERKLLNSVKVNNSIKVITKKVFVDKQQNTWLLTKGNGVYKSIANNFRHFSQVDNVFIRDITASHINKDTLWFTDGSRNLFFTDGVGPQHVQRNSFKTTSISSDINDNLWFGSENKGIYIYKKQVDSLQNLSFDIERLYSENGFPNNQIENIHIQKDTVWVVTKNAGIVQLEYDFENGYVKKINRFNKSNGIKDLEITTSLLYNNQVWYGTKNGALGTISQNTVTHYSRILQQNTPISQLLFHKGQLFIGTLGTGIWKSDISQINNPTLLNTAFISSLNVYQLIFDQKNQLWIGSEKGLDKLEYNNQTITKSIHYNANDGFVGIETSKSNAIKDSKGNLWFGTKNGITSFIPTENKKTVIRPQIVFEEIKVTYQPIDSIQALYKNKVLQLPPNQNNLSFSYKTIDLNHPKRVEYQWKLNELISPWTKNNTIDFPNLPSGVYTFTVLSRNATKLESQPKIFQFTIEKPLLEKSWFIWSVSIAGGMIILVLVLTYIERIKRQNRTKIEKLTLENHLITLEQKALQLQMNPHFIFNVLNGIKALGNSGNTKELNKTVSQFAVLLRAILQNSRKEEISLSEEINTLRSYIELEQQLSSTIFEYEIETHTDSIETEEILIPTMLLQPFVENSIKHGFKGKNTLGKIRIRFEVKQEYLHCTITDNGIGIVQSQRQKTRTSHTSVALKVTRERIKNLSKYSTLDISEMKENDTVLGTKVEFKIPLKTDF